MVLKGVNWIHNANIRSYGLERSHLSMQYKCHIKWSWMESIRMTMQNQVIWSWKESIGNKMIKLGQMVLKGVNWIHNIKLGSYGLERSQLGTQYKTLVIWYWKVSIGYTMIKFGHMVLKGVNWVHNANSRLYALDRSLLGTQW